MHPHPMPFTAIPTYEPLYAKLLVTPLRIQPRWKRKWVHKTRHYPNSETGQVLQKAYE